MLRRYYKQQVHNPGIALSVKNGKNYRICLFVFFYPEPCSKKHLYTNMLKVPSHSPATYEEDTYESGKTFRTVAVAREAEGTTSLLVTCRNGNWTGKQIRWAIKPKATSEVLAFTRLAQTLATPAHSSLGRPVKTKEGGSSSSMMQPSHDIPSEIVFVYICCIKTILLLTIIQGNSIFHHTQHKSIFSICRTKIHAPVVCLELKRIALDWQQEKAVGR